jgi:hypothetical protein
MNWKRGLLRLWAIGFLIWVAACIWAFDFSCFYTIGPWCDWWVVAPWWQSTYLQKVLLLCLPLLGVPAWFAIEWVTNGFRVSS